MTSLRDPSTSMWLQIAERGSATGIWFIVTLATLAGRGLSRAVLRLLAAYYLLFHGIARRASRAYLERIHDRVPLGAIYQHILRFAQVVLDRVFLLRGARDDFEIRKFGHEHIMELAESKRGALFLGAHLGSFEVMQRLGEDYGVRTNIVGYFGNAQLVTSALKKINPKFDARFVEIDMESVDFIFDIRERLEKGEFVAMLADRSFQSHPKASVDFLGSTAEFPTGPFLLATVLRCPVYLTFGLHYPPNRYDLYCEPFEDAIRLPRGQRDEALAELVRRYAARLEHYCRLAPDNWFNFYDFWKGTPP